LIPFGLQARRSAHRWRLTSPQRQTRQPGQRGVIKGPAASLLRSAAPVTGVRVTHDGISGRFRAGPGRPPAFDLQVSCSTSTFWRLGQAQQGRQGPGQDAIMSLCMPSRQRARSSIPICQPERAGAGLGPLPGEKGLLQSPIYLPAQAAWDRCLSGRQILAAVLAEHLTAGGQIEDVIG